MNKKLVMYFFYGFLILVVIFVAANLFSYYTIPIKTEPALYGEIETVTSLSGYIIREESVITSDTVGTVECNIREGERVPVGKKLMTIFQGNVNENALESLRQIDEQIEQLENSTKSDDVFVDDSYKLDSQINKKLYEVVSASHSNKSADITNLKKDIGSMLDKRYVLLGLKTEAQNEQDIDSLKNKRQNIEQSLSNNIKNIFASSSGIFSTFVDGYENQLDREKIQYLKPSDLEMLDNNRATAVQKKNLKIDQNSRDEQSVAKIINNYEWYISAIIDASKVDNYSMGMPVNLRLYDFNEQNIQAVVYYISALENNKAVITLLVTKQIDSVLLERTINFDLVSNYHRGLRIPVKAIRMKDEQLGAYVIRKDEIIKFIGIKIIGKNNDFAIIEEDSTGIYNHDEVIVKGK